MYASQIDSSTASSFSPLTGGLGLEFPEVCPHIAEAGE